MIAQQWIYHTLYSYADQSNSSSIIWQSFENRYFVWQRLKLLSIVEVDWLLATWNKVDRLLLCIWDDFSRWAKTFGRWKGFKKSTTICVQNRMHVGNIKEKQSILIWYWAKAKYIWTSINCDLSVKCRLEPVVSQNIIWTTAAILIIKQKELMVT